jgi:hypothetical protein
MKNFLKNNWFKVGVLVLILLAIILFFAFRDKTNHSDRVNPLMGTAHSTYKNSYYDYSILYPQSWSISGTATNNDGIALYTSDPSADIRIYASIHEAPEFSNPQALKSTLLLDDGSVADMAQVTSATQSILVVSLTKDETVYTFRASGSTKFFEQNKELILQVARTLSVK